MKIAIHYFSGCGNTAWVATRAQKQLESIGNQVVLLQNIEMALPTQMPNADVDIFISPTYFFNIPSNMIAYLKRLPIVAGRKAIFWSVNGGVAGISYRCAKNFLKDKGYEVIAGGNVEMPDTFLFLKESQLTLEQRREVLEKALSQINDNLKVLESLPPVQKENIFKIAIGYVISFLYLVLGRHILGLSFVSTSKCVQCKKCVMDCPAHAITFKDERPHWHTGCVGCFRCINNCPVSAIDISKKAFMIGLWFGIVWAIGFGLLSPVCKVFAALLGFFVGWFDGAYAFQKLYKRFGDKNLCLAEKKRVLLTDEEKDL